MGTRRIKAAAAQRGRIRRLLTNEYFFHSMRTLLHNTDNDTIGRHSHRGAARPAKTLCLLALRKCQTDSF